MQCSDLDRYLEAFLDERLGRGRSVILRRHIAGCTKCRTRILGLRQFEKELNQKLRSMKVSRSIWAGLEFDLVKSSSEDIVLSPAPQQDRETEAPPQPVRAEVAIQAARKNEVKKIRRKCSLKRAGMIAMGMCLLVAAGGTIYRIAIPIFADATLPNDDSNASRATTDLDAIKNPTLVKIKTNSTVELRRWFLRQTGIVFPVLPQPQSHALTGGLVSSTEQGMTATALYATDGLETTFSITPIANFAFDDTADHASATTIADSSGETDESGQAIQWRDDNFHYTLSSALDERSLDAFKAY